MHALYMFSVNNTVICEMPDFTNGSYSGLDTIIAAVNIAIMIEQSKIQIFYDLSCSSYEIIAKNFTDLTSLCRISSNGTDWIKI